MGFFADIASEARRGMVQAPPPAQQTVAAPSPVPEPKPEPPAAPEATAAQPAPEPLSALTAVTVTPEPTPVPEQPEPEQPSAPLAIDLTPPANAADDAERRKAHEAAEAKRKAEWDAKQAEKKAKRQAALDKIKALNDAELLSAAVGRVTTDTERLTRRNMKEAVSEHIQAKCREDAAFAMLVMDPDKSMVNCFQYINRQAQEYAEQEMKDQGIQRTGAYGLDVPDGLCYKWAENYFNDPDAKEDHKDDEKFVPKPYIPATPKKTQGKTAKKPSGPAKSKAGKSSESCIEQISLM